MVESPARDIDAYPHRLRLETRWNDNDAFGHMNNAMHYQFFDTVVNRLLRDLGSLQELHDANRFLVVETGCRYFAEIAYPDLINVGLVVRHLGCSSVRYDLALFRNDERMAAAAGFLVHVNTAAGRAVAMDEGLRAKLTAYYPIAREAGG
ncbi:acyl-CoA thioesterase [Pelagibacterium sediminicola]|uniref:acyl-CoA thioesterase n=1 Tax=Pelagibacterium sediminicola TaxID=2248761 RepID=UPI000E31C453|nr:thioesterase family protein [Pelagibacterium sediminicola]